MATSRSLQLHPIKCKKTFPSFSLPSFRLGTCVLRSAIEHDVPYQIVGFVFGLAKLGTNTRSDRRIRVRQLVYCSQVSRAGSCWSSFTFSLSTHHSRCFSPLQKLSFFVSEKKNEKVVIFVKWVRRHHCFW